MVRQWTIIVLTAAFIMPALTPAAMADSTQKNKNTWRDLGIAGAAVAGYGLLHHNSTATIIGLGGAGYSAYRYEQERKKQDARARWRRNHRYYHRRHYW